MVTPLTVLAPVAGVVTALADVADPVFSGEIVGPGLAVQPDPVAGMTVVAPVAGTVAKLHPHAFVLIADGGRGVLVHLGIDTVQLGGQGFTLHVAEGEVVESGQLLIEWDPAEIERSGRASVCPVIGLEADPASVARLVEPGTVIAAGEGLFTVV